MGIHSDTYEDATEGFGQYVAQDNDGFLVKIPSKPLPVRSQVICPVCWKSILTAQLNHHLIEKHAGSHVYVRLNDRVIESPVYIECWPKKFEIIHLGNTPVSANIIVNGKKKKVSLHDHITSVLNEIREIKDGEIQIIFDLGQSIQKNIQIYIGEQPAFRGADIDRKAYRYLFSNNFNFKRKKYDEYSVPSHYENTLEMRYREGIFDYSVAIDAILCGEDAKLHLERAYDKLKPFTTVLAMSIKNYLAFKMNIFHALGETATLSRFYLAAEFFLHKEKVKSKPVSSILCQQEYGFVMEPFTDFYINCLGAYYQADYAYLEENIERLKEYSQSKDLNDKEKVDLLLARYYRVCGNHILAKEYYLKLTDSLLFVYEAKEYL